MRRNELKSIIIAIIAMIGLIGALCIATPAMAEGNSLPEVQDQATNNISTEYIQDFGMIEIDPDPLAYNESSYNLPDTSTDCEICGSVYSGEIIGVTITPERLVSSQPATFSVSVKNTGSTNTCYQLEYYSNGVHLPSGFERWIEPGDTETFSWQATMGSPGDRQYTFKLYWDRVWYEGSNVLLDTVVVDSYCYAAGLPDVYEPDDTSSIATLIDVNGEAQYHDFHDGGDKDWIKFYMEVGEKCTVETTMIGSRADTYLGFCHYDGAVWHYIYDDDSGTGHGSKITYTCTRSGYHYAYIRQYSPSVYGETTAYSIDATVAAAPGTPFYVGGHVYLGTATVSGADVTVTDLNTGESLTTTTYSNGAYVVALGNLPSGHSAGDTIEVTATYNGQTGTSSAPRSENLSDSPQIIDVTIVAQAVQIKAADGGDLPASIPVDETFTVLITEDGSSVGAGTHVVFRIPHDTGDPVTGSTDDDGKARYKPLITGILGIKVLNGTVTVANATVAIAENPTLEIYTITNTTIIPPETTSIGAEFSEQVNMIVKIEDVNGNLVNELFRSPCWGAYLITWDGTYTNGTTVPDGTYTVNVSGVSTTTGLSVVDTSMTITVGAAGTNVSIDSATVNVDGETTLPIVINNVDDPDGVGTADIKLSFNSDVVHVTASTAGDFDSITPSFVHNESGAASYVTFLAYQVANPGLTSGAIVTTVTLKAVGTAGQESPLDITITTLADNTPAGNEIPADDVDGTFTVRAGRACGDVDTHEGIDARDVSYLAKHVAEISGYETLYGDGDVDTHDGLDARDVSYLAKHVAEIPGYETLHG